MSYVDRFSTSGPICPFCGHEHDEPEDVWEMFPCGEESAVVSCDCENCNHGFKYSVVIATSYEYNSFVESEAVDD